MLSLFLMMSFIYNQPSWAAKPNSPSVAEELFAAQQKLLADDFKQRKVLASLFTINRSIKARVKQKAKTETQVMAVETELADLSRDIDDLQLGIVNKRTKLRGRLDFILRSANSSIIQLILTSQTPAELERNTRLMGRVAKRDLQVIQDYVADIKGLQNKKAKLEAKAQKLKLLAKSLHDQEEQLRIENKNKTNILAKIRNAKTINMSRFAKMREKARALGMDEAADVYDLLLQVAFVEKKGQMPAPVQGRVRQPFGIIRDPFYKVSLAHKGVFISASYGEPVRAVFSGKVVYSGLLEGFGRTLVLHHGDHYYTVYSHLKDVSLSLDEAVVEGQQIGRVSSSSHDYGEGMYFEVRHFSEAQNPLNWIRFAETKTAMAIEEQQGVVQ